MVYKHVFLLLKKGKQLGKQKFLLFFFLQKFKLMNGKNQQTSEILFDKQDFVLLKKKKNLAMLKAATSH